jgi:hypothetical protein
MGRVAGLGRATNLFIPLLLAAACGGPTAPDRPAPVSVTVQPTQVFVGGPDRATFTLRVANNSPTAVDLTFPSSCQVLPYFVDVRSNQPVTPRGGGFACLTVITRRLLTSGESFADVVSIKSGAAPESGFVVLPPGAYAIYARLEDQTYRTQSDRVTFTLE